MIGKHLPENHLVLTAENEIRQICSKLLNPLGISFFNYLRFYNDGSCYLLTTHGSLIEYVFEHHIPVAAPISEINIKKTFNYFILPIGSYDKLVHHAKMNLNLEYFIDLVDRYDHYIELFCFGSVPGNSEIINFYINNLDFLEKFKFYFKEKAVSLLAKGEKNKIILPEIMKPPYQGLEHKTPVDNEISTLIPNNRYFVKGKHGEIKLTPRQYACLSQISNGYTAKEAARNLGISHRTVENYLANLKSILECQRRSQLISIFLNGSIGAKHS